MTKFKPGDVVRIEPKWLDVGEDPNTDYIVLEDLTDEVFADGRVKIMTKAENMVFPSVSEVSYDMVYKIGHVNIGADGLTEDVRLTLDPSIHNGEEFFEPMDINIENARIIYENVKKGYDKIVLVALESGPNDLFKKRKALSWLLIAIVLKFDHVIALLKEFMLNELNISLDELKRLIKECTHDKAITDRLVEVKHAIFGEPLEDEEDTSQTQQPTQQSSGTKAANAGVTNMGVDPSKNFCRLVVYDDGYSYPVRRHLYVSKKVGNTYAITVGGSQLAPSHDWWDEPLFDSLPQALNFIHNVNQTNIKTVVDTRNFKYNVTSKPIDLGYRDANGNKVQIVDLSDSVLVDTACGPAYIQRKNKKCVESLTEELWPKEHNETTVEYFETNEVMKAKVKDWLAAEKPCEYQIENIPEDLTWEEVINAYKEGKEPRGGLHLDTEPREYVWQRAGELYYLQTGEFLDADFERVYKEKRTDLQTPEEKVEGEKMLMITKPGIPEDEAAVEEPVEETLVEAKEENLEEKVRKIVKSFFSEDKSKMSILEYDNGYDGFVETFGEDENGHHDVIDFGVFTYNDLSDEDIEKGKPVITFLLSGGLNGSGDWKDYLSDISDLFKEFEDKLNLHAIIYKANTDIADDVWTAEVLLYIDRDEVKESLNEDLIVVEPFEAKEKLEEIKAQIEEAKDWKVRKNLLTLMNIYLFQTIYEADHQEERNCNINKDEWDEYSDWHTEQAEELYDEHPELEKEDKEREAKIEASMEDAGSEETEEHEELEEDLISDYNYAVWCEAGYEFCFYILSKANSELEAEKEVKQAHPEYDVYWARALTPEEKATNKILEGVGSLTEIYNDLNEGK